MRLRKMSWQLPLLLSSSGSTQQVFNLSTSSWTLQNLPLNISLPASLPSYAHLDLEANQVVGQLEYGLNDFSLRWIWQQNWTYLTTLEGLNTSAYQTYLLFEGLDTFTSISLCDQHVAATNNQFRQYNFDVTNILANCSQADLSINFGSAPQIATEIANEPGQETFPYGTEIVFEIPNREFIRKEQNDFGWDWGPAYAPAGPWKPAYAIQLSKDEIYPRNVLVDIYRQGQRNNLIPDQTQPWVLNASIDLLGTLPSGSSLTYTLKNPDNTTVLSGLLGDINQTTAIITGSTTIEDGAVDLWWPVGFGSQNLYYLTVDIHNSNKSTLSSVTRRVGFRTIVLNEMPISKQQISQGIAPGNNWHFEVNGQEFYAKGSNFIPPDVFWPRVRPDTIRSLFDAVVAGNQNMLRVWSSGAYSPDFMYDIADELGIMLWSEFEFGDALYPTNQEFLDNVYEEAVYQVRRINHHPSMSYWAGGNELENLELPTAKESDPGSYTKVLAGYEKLFLSTLFPAVFENSRSISYAPSSTSNGFISLNFTEAPYFDERYQNTTGGIYGETDYYNYNSAVAFNDSSYPVGRFSNEFGYHSMPSLQTWQDYIPESQLYFNSTFVIYRNRHYPPGGLNITNYANTSKGMGEMTLAAERWYPIPNKTDSVANFSAWCWTTQLFQAEYYGSQIQFYRRGSGLPQRTLGSLYWQLEDQWAAPTWAGIEVSGRWKVLHYNAKDLYSNVIISPFWNVTTSELELWATSDLWSNVTATVDTAWYYWNGTEVSGLETLTGRDVQIGALNSTIVWSANLAQNISAGDLPDLVMRANITAYGQKPNSDATHEFSHTNWFHAAPLSQARLVDPGLFFEHSASNQTVTVTASSGVSAWTWLDYPAGVSVIFEHNGFYLARGESRTLSYNVSKDTTGGSWVNGLTVQSLWNNTLAS